MSGEEDVPKFVDQQLGVQREIHSSGCGFTSISGRNSPSR